MKLQLTNDLLQFLSQQGYRYCFSKTTIDHRERVIINLTPVTKRPDPRRLPAAYDTFFALNREVAVMADGIDDRTLVFVTLDRMTATAYLKHVLRPVLTQRNLRLVH